MFVSEDKQKINKINKNEGGISILHHVALYLISLNNFHWITGFQLNLSEISELWEVIWD